MLSALRKSRRLKTLHGDANGSVFVEAALVLPLAVIILAGIAQWGLTMFQYNQLATATGSAVRQLIINRGFANPYANVMTQYSTWASNLNITGSNVTVEIQNNALAYVACTEATSPTCSTLLDSASGKSARVSVTYNCLIQFNLLIANPCPINISMTGLVE